MNNDNKIKNDAIINAATEQFRALLETNFKKIVTAAEESFIGDDTQTEPVAKCTLSVEWDALASAPRVAVKIGWTAKFKDESETEIDPLQSKLGLGGAA